MQFQVIVALLLTGALGLSTAQAGRFAAATRAPARQGVLKKKAFGHKSAVGTREQLAPSRNERAVQRLLKLPKYAESDLRRLNELWAIQPGAVRVPRFDSVYPQAKRIDNVFSQLLKPKQWNKLKDIGRQLDTHINELSMKLGIPPEGVHPVYANASKSMVRAVMEGRGGDSTVVKNADTRLSHLLEKAPLSALPMVRDHFRSTGVEATLAPKSLAVLKERMPRPSGKLESSLAKLESLLSSDRGGSELAKSDKELALAIRNADPHLVLDIAAALGRSGIAKRDLGHFTFNGGPNADKAPESLKELRKRNPRDELLRTALDKDLTYKTLSKQKTELVAEAASRLSKGTVSRGDSQSLIEFGLRLDNNYFARELARSFAKKLALDPKAHPQDGSLRKRDSRQVFIDHLHQRRINRLDLDLERNYADDVMMVTNFGVFHGKEGMKSSAAILAKVVPGQKWVMERLQFSGNLVYESWSAKVDGKMITGFDSFLIKDGKIALQTAYYGPIRDTVSPIVLDR